MGEGATFADMQRQARMIWVLGIAWMWFLGTPAWGQTSPRLTADEENALRSAPVSPDAPDSAVWVYTGKLDVNFAQVFLSNWAAGGQSTLSLITKFDHTWEFDRGPIGWDSEMHGAFGLLHRPEESVLLKTDDRFEFASKFGLRATTNGFATLMASFRSQFAPGYALINGMPDRTNRTSNIMAPGYGVMAAGMDYKNADRQLTVFLAPVTYKATWVLDDSLSAAGAFGVTPGERSRHEVGGYLKLGWKTPVVENVDYAVRLDLFSNYLNKPENIDIFSDHTLSMKVNDYMTTTISATIIYDDDVMLQKEESVVDATGNEIKPAVVGPGLQLREVLSVGFSLKF